MKKFRNILVLTLFTLVCVMISCTGSKEQKILNHADEIMESQPDSALMLLSAIDQKKLSSKEQKAKYALLMSMALDKNYIDTTTFDVLQPAIDYYLKNGSPDEKLRTYYYQGVIYTNLGDKDKALNSFINGIDISYDSSDSLTIGRTLVAQGNLYNYYYNFDSYIDCNLAASEIFKKLGNKNYEFICLLNVLNGAIVSGKENLGDSVIKCLLKLPSLNENQQNSLTRLKLSYALKFGTEEEMSELIHVQESNIVSQNDIFNIALAYNKIGKYEKAKQYLNLLEESGVSFDTIRHLAISVPILEGSGNYKEALEQYKTFSHKQDSINLLKFEQRTRTIEEKHQIELHAQEDARQKSLIIWGCICGIALLSMGVIILWLLFRSTKTKKELALEKARFQEAENATLKSEKNILSLENRNLQLERDKKTLEAENLTHRVESLENESDSLKALIRSQKDLPLEVQSEIKIRIEMLNSLLASYITNNDLYEKPYDIWIKDLTDNKEEFMNSNRLAFQVSHPRFIKYFEDHGLTIDEINYVCLYAIGLRGKEVGNYMKKRSHVNTSSAIRKKLGIDKHETNIGIYVRRLLHDL